MITPEMTGSYVTVFEPKPNQSGALKYSIMLLIDKSDKEGIAKIEAEVNAAIQKGKESKWGGKVPKFRYVTFRDGDAELESGEKAEPMYKGKMFLSASCGGEEKDPAPQVVGPNALPLMDAAELYSGCIVRADIRFFPYSYKGSNGVGTWLNSVMKIKDGPRLDGRVDAVDAFAGYATKEDDNSDLA